MVLGLGQHDAVDQHAGDLHLARARASPPRAMRSTWAITKPPRVLGRHRGGQVVERQRLALHGDVAGRVGRGAADQRDVDREGLVEQPLLAVDLDQLDQVFGACAR